MHQNRRAMGPAIIIFLGLCAFGTVIALSAAATLWFRSGGGGGAASPLVVVPPTTTPLPTFTPTLTPPPLPPTVTPTEPPTQTPTSTHTPPPTDTPTPIPPTPTLAPPTDTPLPPPPTARPVPSSTPAPKPSFSFTVLEIGTFPTSHKNFDVFVAVTNANNTPISGYRVIGSHSAGNRVESAVSANAWTENSGANHYKAGNIKYQVLNSPNGLWTLQLVDGNGTPVAPPVEFPFDDNNRNWYFLLYRKVQ